MAKKRFPHIVFHSMTSQESIIKELAQERIRQDERWGVQRHEPAKWLAILGEEYGEVCKAVCERLYAEGPNPEYRAELIQVAAVALAMIECHDERFNRLDITLQSDPLPRYIEAPHE